MKKTERPLTAAVAAGIVDGELTYMDTMDLLWDHGDRHLDVFDQTAIGAFPTDNFRRVSQ